MFVFGPGIHRRWGLALAACALTLITSACMGIHAIPLQDGETVELQFDGPVNLGYVLEDGTVQTLRVEQSQELILTNRFDDGDPAQIANPEKLLTYFRLDQAGGNLHLGMDPELKNMLNGNLLFPDPAVRADYLARAEFEFENLATGRLKNSEPIRFEGKFLAAVANRFQYSCVDATGNVVFVYDIEVPKLCGNGNHVEISTGQTPFEYSREEIQTLTSDSFRTLLATRVAQNPVDRPPLVLKIVNTTFDPNPDPPEGDPAGRDNDGLAGDENPSLPLQAGGCSLGSRNPHGISVGYLPLLLGLFLSALLRRPASRKITRTPSRRR